MKHFPCRDGDKIGPEWGNCQVQLASKLKEGGHRKRRLSVDSILAISGLWFVVCFLASGGNCEAGFLPIFVRHELMKPAIPVRKTNVATRQARRGKLRIERGSWR